MKRLGLTKKEVEKLKKLLTGGELTEEEVETLKKLLTGGELTEEEVEKLKELLKKNKNIAKILKKSAFFGKKTFKSLIKKIIYIITNPKTLIAVQIIIQIMRFFRDFFLK